jgi:FeS assembly SUF system protein
MSENQDYKDILQLETNIVQVLKSIYDPEIPVNIYDLGLIYDINIDDEKNAEIVMTLTAPNCPIADQILIEVKEQVEMVEGVKSSDVKLVFDPPWDQNMMTDEAKLELGML